MGFFKEVSAEQRGVLRPVGGEVRGHLPAQSIPPTWCAGMLSYLTHQGAKW